MWKIFNSKMGSNLVAWYFGTFLGFAIKSISMWGKSNKFWLKKKPNSITELFSICTYLWWFHVQDFGDSSLHNQEMWVVHIQLNRSKKIRNPIGLNIGSVYHVFVFATNDNLSGYHNFVVLIITQRALFFVSVVKCDRYRGFGDSSLTIFVDKFLEICSPHLKTIHNKKNVRSTQISSM